MAVLKVELKNIYQQRQRDPRGNSFTLEKIELLPINLSLLEERSQENLIEIIFLDSGGIEILSVGKKQNHLSKKTRIGWFLENILQRKEQVFFNETVKEAMDRVEVTRKVAFILKIRYEYYFCSDPDSSFYLYFVPKNHTLKSWLNKLTEEENVFEKNTMLMLSKEIKKVFEQ